ncbi:hypothetical protein I316_02069 [Kwoniella heveanensis BCC8398]|uniref:Uncharacterized protein n=1 Tax=Kwoniella heveanensis BCC8398 TaxID=1296120 RepID=A0A1B9GYT2_9TREE|nr:hypothetical protein I316_02069 [Kwoniella heveanensis BCC8398]
MPGLKVVSRGLQRVRSFNKKTSREKSHAEACPASPPLASASSPPAYSPSPSKSTDHGTPVTVTVTECDDHDPATEDARRAQLEARVRAAVEGLGADIADRQDAKKAADEHGVAVCDEKIVRDVHRLADKTEPLDHKAAQQLHADAKRYEKSDKHGKDKIAHKLCELVAKVVIHKVVGILLIAALTSVATTTIAALGDPVDVTDDAGNVIGEGNVLPDDDGTYDAYADTDGDGLYDTHVDNVTQTADGNFEADPGDVEDMGVFEALWDVVTSIF